VNKFWQQEELPKRDLLSLEELECVQQTHTVREANGRYNVSLPLKSNIQQLSNTREAALRQFLRLEQRLQSNSETNVSRLHGRIHQSSTCKAGT